MKTKTVFSMLVLAGLFITGAVSATVYNIQYFTGTCISSTAYVTVAGVTKKVACTNGTVQIVVNPYTIMPE